MRSFQTFALAALAAGFTLRLSGPMGIAIAGAPVMIDAGDDASAWTAIASPNASARIVGGQGSSGGAFGLAFDLGRGRAHAIARRAVSIDLPSDFMFVFTLKSDAEPNTIEIKFISGENVWWRRLPDFELPRNWKDVRVSKQRIDFAWGPAGGGMPAHLDAIEIAVVAGKGGKGEVWVDEIRLEPRDAGAAQRPPTVSTSSNTADAGLLLDGQASSVWRSEPGEQQPIVTLDFHEAVEQGGLEVEHAPGGFAADYAVEVSRDGEQWEEARRFTRGDGGLDHVYMPDVYARYVRLRFTAAPGQTVAIGEIRAQSFEFSASLNNFFTAIARAARPGFYPRYFAGEQSYWTVVGVPGDANEALMNEEGSVEVDAGAFTLEPFVLREDNLRTWKDAATTASLEDGDLPIPTVARSDGALSLAVTAFAAGKPGASTLYVRYRLTNTGHTAQLRLFVALRPFQVLPPWQTLNRVGGVARISHISREGSTIEVDGRRIVALTAPNAFGAAAFEEGDITSYLVRGGLPSATSVEDPFGHASAAMAWDIDLTGGASRDVWLAVPWSKDSPIAATSRASAKETAEDADLEALLRSVRIGWRSRVARVPIELPAAARDWMDSVRSNLAYILINRDGAAIQPGSRTYERSWIRDGAMTSGALLELGLDAEVKEYLRWFAGYIGDDGWVPCCVDALGADPVPEHDSFGEFIWAVAEVWRFTRDEAFVREMWPRVKAVAGCMTRLRATRMTPEYSEPARRAYFGLLPESISHEGYSARPVHSYWDQAFALRGYADAAMLASVVGDAASTAALAAERDSFEKALRESIRLTTEEHKLDVVPASVELGDFDPTSTAVSFLLGTEGVYPRDALLRSFDKYMVDLRARRGLTTRGVGYTAYELRNATALVLLGRKAEAVELLDALVVDQRPAAWNQWPEITWLSPTEPSFLGDVPHTWIGSTFVHAVRTLLVTEREPLDPGDRNAASLLVGAGIPLSWFAPESGGTGGEVKALAMPTWHGPLSLTIRRPPDDDGESQVAPATGSEPVRVSVTLEAGRSLQNAGDTAAVREFTIPAGGIEVAAPFGAEVESATVDGTIERVVEGSVWVRRLPATVIFEYKPRLEKSR
ncbi:MAG: discoidin domain-containing protein [Candidatus Binatia bacterium]